MVTVGVTSMAKTMKAAVLAAILAAAVFPAVPGLTLASHLEPWNLFLYCDNNAGQAAWSMETEYRATRCGTHLGMHTWYVGDRGVFTLTAGEWIAKAAETAFSPTVPGDQAVVVEWSTDGISWNLLHRRVITPTYGPSAGVYVPGPTSSDMEPVPPASLPVSFTYIRMRLELSQAGGISGFLNGAYFYLDGTFAGSPSWPAVKSSYTCMTDILEDLFASHPCWYAARYGSNLPGGRIGSVVFNELWYDAASYHHTYPIGTTTGPRLLTGITGTFKVAPWRLADHALQPYDICPLGSQLINNVLNDPTEPLTDQVRVQTSVDGRHWTTRQVVPVLYNVQVASGLPETQFQGTIGLSTPSVQANFVRIVTELAPCYDGTGGAERHESYVFDSAIEITTA